MEPCAMVSDPPPPYVSGVDKLSKWELEENVKRLFKRDTSDTLPYTRSRIRATIKLYKEEINRRDPHLQKSHVTEKPYPIFDHPPPPPYIKGIGELSDQELVVNIRKNYSCLESLECKSYKYARLKATMELYQDELNHRSKPKIPELENPQILETTEKEIGEYLKSNILKLRSSVEMSGDDLECLAPRGHLRSSIMNFYIEHLLQQEASLRDRPLNDYLVLNTFFYEKLKQVVSDKQSCQERKENFAKLRKWLNDVNIFQKAYLLIPINEDDHWSLIIICIPDKKDKAGTIILHLDSASLHRSELIFDHIRRYLIGELVRSEQECVSPVLANISTHVVAVPQQKNSHDCGLFVLYFIKRFLEEAPERLKIKDFVEEAPEKLKTKDLKMFGEEWFKSEEASGLRVEIKSLVNNALATISQQ